LVSSSRLKNRQRFNRIKVAMSKVSALLEEEDLPEFLKMYKGLL